jgi:DnaJ-class molecular chaperone
MGQIIPGEEVVLSKDNADGRWVVLHRKDRCDGTVHVAPSAPDGPWATLFLAPGAPPEVIKAVYRALSQKYHPDRGGDVAKMQEINAAMSELIK